VGRTASIGGQWWASIWRVNGGAKNNGANWRQHHATAKGALHVNGKSAFSLARSVRACGGGRAAGMVKTCRGGSAANGEGGKAKRR